MSELQHVYLTAHGEFTAANWVGETAQMGVRLAFAEVGAEPAKGSTFTMQANGEAVGDSGTQAGTNGTLNKTWTARLGPTGSLENFDAAQQIDVAEDFRTLLNAVKVYQTSGFRWTHIKIAPISASGAYCQPSAIYQLTTPIAGTGSGSLLSLPPEVALALSFRANVIGRSGRGRMYLPALHSTIGDYDGTPIGSVRTTIAGWVQTFVGNLENAAGIDEQTPILAVTSAGKSTAVRPSQVRIGNHFDVQRRRQHQATETYTSVTL